MIKDFRKDIRSVDAELLRFGQLETLQVNLGNRCNQSCTHCHVQAGPNGKNIMSKEVMKEIIVFLSHYQGLCLDITGGCPELNPDFKFFVSSIRKLVASIIIRTNLTVLFEPGLSWVTGWYANNKVVLTASLPCYTEENVDEQRGKGVFKKSIKALRLLNGLGYGVNGQLELNLVYNTGGDSLPGLQEKIEADYKSYLKEKYAISFNRLFTITNAPIGRFRKYLKANGKLEQYLQLLTENFNPQAAENIMCRKLVSIDYKGFAYNCDFNQALNLTIVDTKGLSVRVDRLGELLSENFEIITGDHCYCCTAGAGSSCTGTLVK